MFFGAIAPGCFGFRKLQFAKGRAWTPEMDKNGRWIP
jgi:hypothetical protein